MSDPHLEPSFRGHGLVPWGRSRQKSVSISCRTLLLNTRRDRGGVRKVVRPKRRQDSSRKICERDDRSRPTASIRCERQAGQEQVSYEDHRRREWMVHEWSLILQPASEERNVSGDPRRRVPAVSLCLPPMTDVREDAVTLSQRYILTVDSDLACVGTVDQQATPVHCSRRRALDVSRSGKLGHRLSSRLPSTTGGYAGCSVRTPWRADGWTFTSLPVEIRCLGQCPNAPTRPASRS